MINWVLGPRKHFINGFYLKWHSFWIWRFQNSLYVYQRIEMWLSLLHLPGFYELNKLYTKKWDWNVQIDFDYSALKKCFKNEVISSSAFLSLISHNLILVIWRMRKKKALLTFLHTTACTAVQTAINYHFEKVTVDALQNYPASVGKNSILLL